ncbi:hypothetical protein DFH09DRAFT_1188028 [Mycena vulgaris]|nr:hypothetical protein DFH09DRAFT_1188028 [Mycena vulgaris]
MQFLTIVSLALVSCAASVSAAPAPSGFKITINIDGLAPGTSARIAEHTSLSAPNLECFGPCQVDVHCSAQAGCICYAPYAACMSVEAAMELRARPQRVGQHTFADKREA